MLEGNQKVGKVVLVVSLPEKMVRSFISLYQELLSIYIQLLMMVLGRMLSGAKCVGSSVVVVGSERG